MWQYHWRSITRSQTFTSPGNLPLTWTSTLAGLRSNTAYESNRKTPASGMWVSKRSSVNRMDGVRIFSLFFFFSSRNTGQAKKPTSACTASVRELRTRSRFAAGWTTAPGVSGATLPLQRFLTVSLRRSSVFSSDSPFWSCWCEKCFFFF